MMFLRSQGQNGGKKWLSAINECRYGRGKPPGSGIEVESAIASFNQLEQTGSRFSIAKGSGKSTGPTSS